MKDRDRREFDSSALVHLPELLRFGIRLTGNRTLAEDLVQETYLRGWRAFDRFEPGTNCRAWLYKILLFVHAGFRRQDSRAASLINIADVAESGYEPDSPDVFTAAALQTAFDALPEPFRTAVLLADVQELTYKEIAEALDVPIGTVMSRLNRGRRLLRSRLREQAAAFGLGQSESHKRRTAGDA